MATYNKGFRIKVVKEAIKPEMQGMEEHIAKKYGIRPDTVRRWVAIYNDYGESGLGVRITSPAKKSDKEIQLEKENAALREEIEILKKAAAFLVELSRKLNSSLCT